ncbi:MAG: VRR-NUC domain-containing protein [Pseudomonadota bacterium]
MLDNPFYYLHNFRTVLDWVGQRYDDLLAPSERQFLAQFVLLPQAAQALLVRMIMRKGDVFRVGKLQYAEIGDPAAAASALLAAGWIESDPVLTLDQLFEICTKAEIAQFFNLPSAQKSLRKPDLLALLRSQSGEDGRHFSAWFGGSGATVYRLVCGDLCERLRLMFFGNLYQDWTEFILSDLGITRYESVALSAASRAFQHRHEIDDYVHLDRCRQRFWQGEAASTIVQNLPPQAFDNPWLESRRAKLLYQIAYQHEQQGDFAAALQIYASCSHPGTRSRQLRVLERCGQFEQAYALAHIAEQMPASESEQQQLARIVPRLRRKLGLPKLAASAVAAISSHDLALPRPASDVTVELAVRAHLSLAAPDAPVFYVENGLVNSLMGLLCWEVIFMPLAGAFFHPFHHAPADLFRADFVARRAGEFTRCLAQLDSDQYRQTIHQNLVAKAGIQSPFVYWHLLTPDLLALALDCIPAQHLKKLFQRLLADIKVNRAGLPDLIQFWPQSQRCQMIEVKGPGDRLQDNQRRWLDYFAAHQLPATVCYVQWKTEQAAEPS